MRKLVPPALLWLIAAACGASHAPPTSTIATDDPPLEEKKPLSLTVLGHDGEPLRLGHVTLAGTVHEVGANGRLTLPAPEADLVVLRITGVDHAEHKLALLAPEQGLDLRINLGTFERPQPLSGVAVMPLRFAPDGSISPAGDPVAMTQDGDGVFIAEVKSSATSLYYEITGANTAGHTVNGTDSDSWRYDQGGDYASMVPASDGKAVVRFDPKLLPPAGRKAEVVFSDPESSAARFAVLHAEVQTFAAAYQAQIQRMFEEKAKAGESSIELRPTGVVPKPWLQDLYKVISDESNPRAKAAFTVLYAWASRLSGKMRLEETHKSLAAEALRQLDARSGVWALSVDATMATVVLADSPDEYETFLDELARTMADRDTAAALMFQRMAQSQQDPAKLSRLVTLMKNHFGQKHQAMLMAVAPKEKTAAGKSIPAFSAPSLDRPKQRISDESLRGKLVLIEFWATWCKPCVAVLPELTRLHAKYKKRGFEILSIDYTESAETVQGFRKKHSKMPWLHIVLDEEPGKELGEAFEVGGFPTALLVAPDGTILKSTTGFSPGALEELIEANLPAK
jgi:thiol-disulfide isomerase/thioredoxin